METRRKGAAAVLLLLLVVLVILLLTGISWLQFVIGAVLLAGSAYIALRPTKGAHR